MCILGDQAGSSFHIIQADIRAGGEVDDHAVRPGNAGFQQRAGNGSLGGIFGLACTLGAAHAHVGIAGILHGRAHIGKVQVDEGRHIDQCRNALHALAQHIVGSLKSVDHGDLFLADQLQALIGDHDQAVHVLQQVGNALLSQALLAAALKGKGLGHDANGQNAQLVCHLGHHRGSARAGAAAHTGGDEHHLRTAQGIGDIVLAFLGGALADLRVSACAAALGELCAQLHLHGGAAVVQCLLVRVHGHKLYALQPCCHHAVHSVAAAAANTYHLDVGYILHFLIQNKSHETVPLSFFVLYCPAAVFCFPLRGSAAAAFCFVQAV